MKISPINEMMPAYRDIRQVENKELELNIQKTGAGQIPDVKENAPADKPAEKPAIDDGRKTIGISNDGDVAKASREGINNANEGLVLKKTPEIQDADKDTKVNSLLSYSKDELERLYLQGKINSNQLDKELERREEIRGEQKNADMAVVRKEKEENKANETIARNMEDKREYGIKEVTKRDSEVVKINKEISDTRAEKANAEKTEVRNERDQVKEDTAVKNDSDEARKRIITEEMGLDNEFIEKMSVLAGAERDDEIKSEALDTAAENGRLKIMEQIIGVDPATASTV